MLFKAVFLAFKVLSQLLYILPFPPRSHLSPYNVRILSDVLPLPRSRVTAMILLQIPPVFIMFSRRQLHPRRPRNTTLSTLQPPFMEGISAILGPICTINTLYNGNLLKIYL
jgi:hypothetical protein